MRDISKYWECQHELVSLPRARTTRSKTIQYRKQCLDCGRAIGNVLKHEIALRETQGNPKPFDEQLREDTYKRYNEYKIKNISDNYVTMQVADNQWWEWYNEYLKSPKWDAKRQRVIQRCRGVCEGCMTWPAVHVHHLTYKNVGDELLFQLVGLCRSCHEKSHAQQESSRRTA